MCKEVLIGKKNPPFIVVCVMKVYWLVEAGCVGDCCWGYRLVAS